MRKGQDHFEDREEQPLPMRRYSTSGYGELGATPPVRDRGGLQGSLYANENTQMVHPRPLLYASSSESSIYLPLPSRSHVHEPIRATTLPSPSSLSYPPVPSLSSLSPQSSFSTSAAQTSHLQNLQHQLSSRTLALTNLQSEHNILLAKFERQQTDYSILIRQNELSDNRINSLITERDNLQAQVVELRKRAEELAKERNEERKEETKRTDQYVKILGMATELEKKTQEERSEWKKKQGVPEDEE
jgi:hypothetical protein